MKRIATLTLLLAAIDAAHAQQLTAEQAKRYSYGEVLKYVGAIDRKSVV